MLSDIWNNMWVMVIIGYISLTVLMIYMKIKGNKVNTDSGVIGVLKHLSFALLTLSIGGVCMIRFSYLFVDYMTTVIGGVK